MRNAVVAALPLALMAASANAATTVSGNQTTPIATSTAGDITITASGVVSVSGTTPAVTLDSSNILNNAGTISIKDVNGATGVLILGGNTGSFTNSATITVNETYAATDSVNSDSIAEAPFASGSGRYGVRLTGASPFNGDFLNSGAITVQGNGSYGVSLEAQLNGGFTHSGTISLTGDSGTAFQELGGITGSVTLTGAVSAKGQGSRAVDLEGDVGGRFSLYSALTSTGYATTTRPTTPTSLTAVQGTATDVEQGGSALVIGGNVASGVYLGAQPTGTISGSTADVDADGIADPSEGTASVTTYGSAPAVVIGAANKAIALGAVGGSDLENVAQPANAYGFINRGAISGLGLFDGVSATAMQIGGLSGGTVALAGGLRNVGSIVATSYSADALGLGVGAGATVPEVRNEGTLEAIIAASTGVNTATALSIGAGARVITLTNTGTLLASVTGDSASAVAVVDRSGTISSVLNEGAITAKITPTVSTDATTGTLTALNLASNTSGVTLVQQTNPNLGIVYGSTSGTAATATSTATAVTPSITGDITLGSGADTVKLLAGSITGALDFGTGADSFTIDNGATYSGALRYAGTGMALSIPNGTLTDTNAATLQLTSLAVGAASKLVFAVDPVAGVSTKFVVAGAASFASGSSIGFTAKSLFTGSQSFILVTSPNLSFSSTSLSLSVAPYLLDSSLSADTTPGAGSVTLTVRRRSAAELGLNAGEAAAFEPTYAALGRDASVEASIFAQTDRAGFIKQYDRLLPDYAGGVFDLVDQAARRVSAAALDPDVRNIDAGRLWTQEFALGARRDADSAAGAYETTGLGVAGGVEGSQGPLGALGVDVAFMAGQARNVGANRVDLYGIQGGLYWRAVYGGLQLGARGGAGYNWLSGERVFNGLDASAAAFSRTASAKWNAFQATGAANAAYELALGPFYVRPQVQADYVRLSEDAYTETGGGDALNLAVAARTGNAFSATATAAAGWRFGAGPFHWRPEIQAGARDVFSGDAGATTARFVSGGDSFTLLPGTIKGTGVVGRASITAESDVFRLGVEAAGEERSGRQEGSLLVRAKALF